MARVQPLPGQQALDCDDEIDQTSAPDEISDGTVHQAWQAAAIHSSPDLPTLTSQPSVRPSFRCAQRSLQFITNSKHNVSAGDHRWLLMRISASIVDQVLDYIVVATTILDREYTLTAIQVCLIVVAGWKTSFFVGSSFGNKKPVVVEPTREEEMSEIETESSASEIESEEEPVRGRDRDVAALNGTLVALRTEMWHDSENGCDFKQSDDEVASLGSDLAGSRAPNRTSVRAWTAGSDVACLRAPGRHATGSSIAGSDIEDSSIARSDVVGSRAPSRISASAWIASSDAACLRAPGRHATGSSIAGSDIEDSSIVGLDVAGSRAPIRTSVRAWTAGSDAACLRAPGRHATGSSIAGSDIEDSSVVGLDVAGSRAPSRTSVRAWTAGSDAACLRAPSRHATGSSVAGSNTEDSSIVGLDVAGSRAPSRISASAWTAGSDAACLRVPGQHATGSTAFSSDIGGSSVALSGIAGSRSEGMSAIGSAADSLPSGGSKKQAEASYLHNASIASAKPLDSVVSPNAPETALPKRYNAKSAKTNKSNPLNTVSLWGDTSFISIVMSPRALFKGIFEIEKLRAAWIIVTGDAEEDLAVQKDAWGKFASGELARGLFMTIPQTYLQMYIFLNLWLGDCSNGAQVSDASACYHRPLHPETATADKVQFFVTMASVMSSVISAAAACFNYECLMLRNSGLPAPRLRRNPVEYVQASYIWPVPLGMMMLLSRALEVCARTINVTFFLFFCSLSMSTKIIVVAGGEFVFLFGFAVRKVILTRAWRRAQREQLAAEARESGAGEEDFQPAWAAPRAAPQSVTMPSLCETARLLLQSVSITLPMYTTIHSQRLFEAAFGPGIPYPLFYGYRIGVQSIGLHLVLLLHFGVEESLPRFWTVLTPIMMVSLHILWLPVWRAVVGEVRIFAREVHGVGKSFLS